MYVCIYLYIYVSIYLCVSLKRYESHTFASSVGGTLITVITTVIISITLETNVDIMTISAVKVIRTVTDPCNGEKTNIYLLFIGTFLQFKMGKGDILEEVHFTFLS